MRKSITLKWRIAMAFMGLCSFMALSAQTFPIEIEAEDANVFYYMSIGDRALFSGGQSIGGRDLYGSYVRYNINDIALSGTYSVTIHYASAQNRHVYSKVNNQFPVKVTAPDMGSWDDPTGTVSYMVYFDAGDNVLEIGSYNPGDMEHLPNIDKLVITESGVKIVRPTDAFRIDREAEHFDRGTATVSTSSATLLSNGQRLSLENKYAEYDITVPVSGEYELIIYYTTMDSRSFYIKANDGARVPLVRPENTQSWGDTQPDASKPVTYRIRTKITLNAGGNLLIIGHDNTDGFNSTHPLNVDKFEIVKYESYVIDEGTGSGNIDSRYMNIYTSSNKLFIQTSTSDSRYIVVNLLGETVTSGLCKANTTEIALPAGIYVVRVNDISRKVMIK
jgi:hypothetical protein